MAFDSIMLLFWNWMPAARVGSVHGIRFSWTSPPKQNKNQGMFGLPFRWTLCICPGRSASWCDHILLCLGLILEVISNSANVPLGSARKSHPHRPELPATYISGIAFLSLGIFLSTVVFIYISWFLCCLSCVIFVRNTITTEFLKLVMLLEKLPNNPLPPK